MSEIDQPAGERTSSRDRNIAIAFVLAMLALVAVAYLVSRNQPSAGSRSLQLERPLVSAEQGCQNFADYWQLESGLNIPGHLIEGMTNCREAVDGSWIIPDAPDDPRQARPLPSGSEADPELEAAVKSFEESIPAELGDELQSIYSDQANPVIGHLREGMPISQIRERYAEMVDTFLEEPGHELLADFVAWHRVRSAEAFAEFVRLCQEDQDLAYLHPGCRGLESGLGIGAPPFPWEMNDPLMRAQYLQSANATQGEPT